MPRADGHLTKERWDSPAMQQEWLKKAADQEDFRRKYLSIEAYERNRPSSKALPHS